MRQAGSEAGWRSRPVGARLAQTRTGGGPPQEPLLAQVVTPSCRNTARNA
jgi:hypothetical protein